MQRLLLKQAMHVQCCKGLNGYLGGVWVHCLLCTYVTHSETEYKNVESHDAIESRNRDFSVLTILHCT